MTDGPSERSLAATHTEMTEMVLPNDTNTHGRALGGRVLHWMDVCGAVAAMRFARERVVTASIDHVDFVAPVDLGEVATVAAYVFGAGRTSVDVRVEVEAENPLTGETRETTGSFLTFVAVDDGGAPTPVPTLVCPTDAEERRREAARTERATQAEAALARTREE